MSAASAENDLVPYTFATWAFALHVAGVHAEDEQIRTQCQAILEATEAGAGNAAGEALVARVQELIDGDTPEEIGRAARVLYGDHVRADLGDGDRMMRTARIRKYQFTSQLPWLARIWERQGDAVRPNWLLVERVTDLVTAADPNPWNDIDEERNLSVSDFHVLWELDGCPSLYLQR